MAGLPVYFYYQSKIKWKGFRQNFSAGLWMVVYLLCMMTISYLGSEKFGGLNIIPFGLEMVIITCLSLMFYSWAIKSGFQTEYLEQGQKVNEDLRSMENNVSAQTDKKNAV
jgi:hypothetical protein